MRRVQKTLDPEEAYKMASSSPPRYKEPASTMKNILSQSSEDPKNNQSWSGIIGFNQPGINSLAESKQ